MNALIKTRGNKCHDRWERSDSFDWLVQGKCQWEKSSSRCSLTQDKFTHKDLGRRQPEYSDSGWPRTTRRCENRNRPYMQALGSFVWLSHSRAMGDSTAPDAELYYLKKKPMKTCQTVQTFDSESKMNAWNVKEMLVRLCLLDTHFWS